MKKLLTFLFLLSFSLFSFANEIENLKTALSEKNTSKIQIILESTSDEELPEAEALILQEAKTAVSQDNLDYASSLAEMVLMTDFDNNEAQKLYTSIEKAKKTKAETIARKKAEEEKRQAEAKKQQEIQEQKRQLEEFQEQKKKEEEAKNEYIKSVSKIDFSNFPMSYALTVPFEFSKSTFADQFNDESTLYTRIGAGINANVGFNHPYVKLNIHLLYDFLPVQINEAGMKSDFRSRITAALPAFSPLFALSLGLNTYSVFNDNNAVLYKTLTAPTIGIGLEKMKLTDQITISLFTDLNLITLDKNSEVNFAWDAEFSFRYTLPVTILNIGKLYVENQTSINSITLSKENEWYLDTIFMVGVSINE